MPQTQSLLEEELRRGNGGGAGWPWRLFIVTTFVLAFAVVVYLGLEMGYRPYVASQVRQLDGEIASLNNSLSETDKANLLLFYSRLNNVNILLKNQSAPARVFAILEQTTVKGVYYRAVTVDTAQRIVALEGSAPNYRALTEQLAVLKSNAAVAGIDLKGSQYNQDTKGVNFSVALTLASTALLQ